MARTPEELEKENNYLKEVLKDSLSLIQILSNLEEPLSKSVLTREFKMFYVRVVSRIKKIVI